MPMPWVARLQLVYVCVHARMCMCVCVCEVLDHDEGGCSYTEILEHKIIGGQFARLFCFSQTNRQKELAGEAMKYHQIIKYIKKDKKTTSLPIQILSTWARSLNSECVSELSGAQIRLEDTSGLIVLRASQACLLV